MLFFINLLIIKITNEFITVPKTVNDLFIFEASFKASPDVYVFFYLSEPAKSIKCIFEFFLQLRIRCALAHAGRTQHLKKMAGDVRI